jgi:hypothetical protein
LGCFCDQGCLRMQRDFSEMPDKMIRSQIGDLARTEDAVKHLAEYVLSERLLLEAELARRRIRPVCCGVEMEIMRLFDDGGFLEMYHCKTCSSTRPK